jgi:hypothetical protein
MSSAEKPYVEPTFTFNQKVVGFAFLFSVVLALTTAIHFYVPQTSQQQLANQEQMVEMVCRGESQGPPAYSEDLCGKRAH